MFSAKTGEKVVCKESNDIDQLMLSLKEFYRSDEVLSDLNLSKEGLPEEYIRAVESHGWGICNDVEPQTDLEKVLYTIDELTGLVTATVLMRPSKSVLDMGLSSVKKKWKQKSFAAGVNREVIEKGMAKLEMDMDKLIEETIAGMRKVADVIGLAGDLQAV